MNTFGKFLVASVLVTSFAAPAFAAPAFGGATGTEGMLLAERNVYTNPKTPTWTSAYAMEVSVSSQQPTRKHWNHVRDFDNRND